MRMRVASILFLSAVALAEPGAPDDSAEEASPPAPSTGPNGFRFGVDASAGLFDVTESPGFAGPMGIVDLRVGPQISDRFAAYLQPSLWLGGSGKLSFGALSGTVLAELALPDTYFAAAGAGYGVLQSSEADNPVSGLMLEARFGGYPLRSSGAPGSLRSRLMLGLDVRTLFYGEGTALLVTGGVGYELF